MVPEASGRCDDVADRLQLPDRALGKGHKVREGERRNRLTEVTGEPRSLTFLWEGPQDASFIKGIKQALDKGNTCFEKFSAAILCVPTLRTRDTDTKGGFLKCQEMPGVSSLALWFPPEWGTNKRPVNSGGLFTQSLPVGMSQASCDSAEGQAALSTQPFCLQGHFLPPLTP